MHDRCLECECCGQPLGAPVVLCDGCAEGDCDPAVTWHCDGAYGHHCDGTACAEHADRLRSLHDLHAMR